MSNTYFIKSKYVAFPWQRCEDPLHDDTRGPRQLDTENPNHYWNPKRKARIKRICPVCYAARQHKKKKAKAKFEKQKEQRLTDLEELDYQSMKWSKVLPRESGWFWVRDDSGFEWIGHVEGRDATDDGWLWYDLGNRIYLTPGSMRECGEVLQHDGWLKWEWAGPIPMPRKVASDNESEGTGPSLAKEPKAQITGAKDKTKKEGEMQVASVTNGWSWYHDALWGWLNDHSGWFDDYGYEMVDVYSFWRAWGMLAFVGCRIECYGTEEGAPPEYACDWGVGVNIRFDGEIKELLRRLDYTISNVECPLADNESEE